MKCVAALGGGRFAPGSENGRVPLDPDGKLLTKLEGHASRIPCAWRLDPRRPARVFFQYYNSYELLCFADFRASLV